jgi:parallel beta-helix repeat protein
VQFVSADVSQMSRLSEVNIENASNIAFENIEFRADSKSEAFWDRYVVRVAKSTDIDFSNSVFSGGNNMQNAGLIGLYVDGSSGVEVTDSEFTNTTRGAIFSNSEDLTVQGNTLHNLQSDGFNFVGVKDVLIDQNKFTDFYPLEGDHADYIQFWLAGARQGSENVIISNNFMAQSEGDRVQGIFITDTNEHTNTNFTIENNLVYQSGYHGITVAGIDGLVLKNNTVISSDNSRDTWIKVSDAIDANISNNISNKFLLDDQNSLNVAENSLVNRGSAGALTYADLFKNAINAYSDDPTLFLLKAEVPNGADMDILVNKQV